MTAPYSWLDILPTFLELGQVLLKQQYIKWDNTNLRTIKDRIVIARHGNGSSLPSFFAPFCPWSFCRWLVSTHRAFGLTSWLFSLGSNAPTAVHLKCLTQTLVFSLCWMSSKLFSTSYFKYIPLPYYAIKILEELLVFLHFSSLPSVLMSGNHYSILFNYEVSVLSFCYVRTCCILLIVSVLSLSMQCLSVPSLLLQMAGFNFFMMAG